jgi:hypothetical protein
MILSEDDLKEILSIITNSKGFLEYFVADCDNKYFNKDSVLVKFDINRLNIRNTAYSLILYPMNDYDKNFFHYYEILTALADIGVGPDVYQPMLMTNPGKCIDYSFDPKLKYMIIPSEQFQGLTMADMKDLGGKYKDKILSLKVLDSVIKQISRMHKHDIIHGDLRDSNVVIGTKDTVYLINPVVRDDSSLYKLSEEDRNFDLGDSVVEYYREVVGGIELLNSYGYRLPKSPNATQHQTQYPSFSQ